MRYKKPLIAVLAAAVLTLTPVLSANAATAPNPLVQNGEFKYNGVNYSINLTPVSGSATVTRDYYRVASTYTVRITQDTGVNGKQVYKGNLGYTRAAYLHTKLIGLETAYDGGLDVKRDYGIATYLQKVTGFSVDYDRARLDTLISNYRENQLRKDVTATAQHVRNYLAAHDNLDGIQNDSSIVSKRNLLFGYSGDNVSVRLFVDPADSAERTFEVVGLEKPDLYQSVHDSATGAVRSGPIETVSNLD